MNFAPFDVGALWKHKTLNVKVFIRSMVKDDEGNILFRLGELNTRHPDFGTGLSSFLNPIKNTIWTAEELIRNFTPLLKPLRPSALERILAGEDLFDEDQP